MYKRQVCIISECSGKVTAVSADEITVEDNIGLEHKYKLTKFKRSNQGTCVNQRPIVSVGENVEKRCV